MLYLMRRFPFKEKGIDLYCNVMMEGRHEKLYFSKEHTSCNCKLDGSMQKKFYDVSNLFMIENLIISEFWTAEKAQIFKARKVA